MADIFISYSWDDHSIARAIYHRLIADGLIVWMDNDQIIDGGELQNSIQRAINKCSVFLLVSSKSAIRSDYVNKEINWALERKTDLTIVPIAIQERSFHPRLENLNHIRFNEFVCFEEGYRRCSSILRRHLKLSDRTSVAHVIDCIFNEFPKLSDWIRPLRIDGRIRIASVKAVPRFDVPPEIIDLALMLLCEEAINDSDKCFQYLIISAEVICDFGYGFSALWCRSISNDIWLETEKKKDSFRGPINHLCSALSHIHKHTNSHSYFIHMLGFIEPFDHYSLTNFVKSNYEMMSEETTERLASLLVRKDPKGNELSHIEAVCEFYRRFPENQALVSTLHAWLEANQICSLGHQFFLDELRIYNTEFGKNKNWIEKKYVNSFRYMLRQNGVKGIMIAARSLNYTLKCNHELVDRLYSEWSNGLMSSELSNYRENDAFMSLMRLFDGPASVQEEELEKILGEISKTK